MAGATDQLLDARAASRTRPRRARARSRPRQPKAEANQTHAGDPALDTADFTDDTPGNLRVDYVLPSNGLDVLAADVFWPSDRDALSRLVTIEPLASSDHRLVWVDLV